MPLGRLHGSSAVKRPAVGEAVPTIAPPAHTGWHAADNGQSSGVRARNCRSFLAGSIFHPLLCHSFQNCHNHTSTKMLVTNTVLRYCWRHLSHYRYDPWANLLLTGLSQPDPASVCPT